MMWTLTGTGGPPSGLAQIHDAGGTMRVLSLSRAANVMSDVSCQYHGARSGDITAMGAIHPQSSFLSPETGLNPPIVAFMLIVKP